MTEQMSRQDIYCPLTFNGYSNSIKAVKRQRNLGLHHLLTKDKSRERQKPEISVTYVNKNEMEQSGLKNGEGRRLFSNCLGGFILSVLGSKKMRHVSVSSWPVKVSFSSSSCLLKLPVLRNLKRLIVNKSLNYERLNMWAEVINIQTTPMRPTKMNNNSRSASMCINLMMFLMTI